MTLGTFKTKTNQDYGTENKTEDKNKVVDYDELLSAAGEWGPYQMMLIVSTLPFYIFGAFANFGQLFITEVSPNHWCWIPELKNLTDIERRNLAIPADDNAGLGYSRCTAYSANWTHVLLTGEKPDSTWSTEPCNNGWEFNKTEIPYQTISSELGWVCERDSYQATAQSIFSVGSIFGGFIFGWVADRYGRLAAAVLSNIVGCLAGVVTIFATNFVQFSVCRFFLGMSYDNCMMMSYLLLLEYSAPRYRSIIANLPFAVFYAIGLSILPWIALACGHWKTISLAVSLPLAAAVLAPLIITESPRWLISKGRMDEAIKKIQNMARINRKEISKTLIADFKQAQLEKPEEECTSIMELLRRPRLRFMFINMCLCYTCCMIVFDASVRNLGLLQFDFFLSFTLVSITECPSLILMSVIVDWSGRKCLSLVAFLVCFVLNLVIAFTESPLISVIMALISRFFINMAFNTAMQWAAEVFPTSVRGSAVSVVHILGYIGTVVSPFIAYLNTVVYWLPLVVVSGISLVGAVVVTFLPETARKEMPQTFENAEQLMATREFFVIPCLKSKKNMSSTPGYVNEYFVME